MNQFTADTLYELLPAVYRTRDIQQDGPLRALVEVLAEQAGILEQDIAGLYENWFIETCDEWVVPYIGDLLEVRSLHTIGDAVELSQRAYVANTLRYRRRKGTASMLKQLARDTTGWPARAVEFFQLLATTQHVNHVRLDNPRTPDLGNTSALARLDTAFDSIAHTADIRASAPASGRYNIANIGLFLWRLQSYRLLRSQPRARDNPTQGCYWFDSLGRDRPLFNRPQTQTDSNQMIEEINVPMPLRRRPLHDELEARRQALAAGKTPVYRYFDDRENSAGEPVFAIYIDGRPIPAERILICNLEDWHLPPATKKYTVGDDSREAALPITVAVDPVLGRMAFPTDTDPEQVEVSYAYGFPGDLGAGSYDRSHALQELVGTEVAWRARVNKNVVADPENCVFNTLTAAIAAWNARQQPGTGVLSITDNAIYQEDLTGNQTIILAPGCRLFVIAASGAGDTGMATVGHRPHLLGELSVRGTADADDPASGELTIDGLIIEGSTKVLVGNLGLLRLAHSTCPQGLSVHASTSNPLRRNSTLRMQLERSICGPLVLPPDMREVRVINSILHPDGNEDEDGDVNDPQAVIASGPAATDFGPPATIQRSTLLGAVRVDALTLASEVIFAETVTARRLQAGCARFSYIPADSTTPRRYRCQPELALQDYAEAHGLDNVDQLQEGARKLVEARVTPGFVAVDPVAAACAQLSRTPTEEIRAGAEDGNEMGAWHFLQQAQREDNLRASFAEYLPVGMNAQIFFSD